MTNTIELSKVVWDKDIYPRDKWSTSTIDRYVDALEAGSQFPPIVLEKDTNRLLDGKHRLEAHKKAGLIEITAEWRTVPGGMTARYFAASLSSQHGDRLSNADLKNIAEADFECNPNADPVKWGQGLGVSKSTVYRWVSHILEREKADEASKAWRLTKLGWTSREIAARLGKESHATILSLVNFSQLGKIDQTQDCGMGFFAQPRCNLPASPTQFG